MPEIRKVERSELEECLAVIHKSFATVAEQFGLTRQNCPKHTSFMPLEYLRAHMDWEWQMFGLYENGIQTGYVSLSEKEDGVWEMHNLAVLPERRHKGYGKMLVRHAKEYVRAAGGKKIAIGIIAEHALLRVWYEKKGFVYTGSRKFDHLPFTAGFMECSVIQVGMIALDLDRTFLHTDKSISDYSLAVLDRCREKGIKIIVATARSEKAAEAYTQRIQPDIIVSNGGSRVRCGKETVWNCLLSAETTEAIVSAAKKEAACLDITVETEEGYYVTWEQPNSPDYEHAIHCDFAETFQQEAYKITLDIRDRRAAERIAEGHPECSMTPFSDEKWYRFAHKDATKMNGVRHAAEYLGIDVKQVAAFGDDTSDLDMIKGCGIGVAMGNAIEAVKAAADAVCRSNDEAQRAGLKSIFYKETAGDGCKSLAV